ncbi:hypothetical protein B0T25DRAFT_466995 [Lasiosphaeria hispida]|uniref:Uncharacterized protein n=1 Tax=Lasiosphaeria hispida TaxID=260671 RepID=A0AAJ0M7V4_9PEZI|nr:hypothetical protein B0T25DRAFT_466995 [Lasiosphaeria hispida]
MSVSSIRIYINMALEYLDSPYRVDDVEPNLQQAEQRLSSLSPDDAGPLIAQIADIRAKLDNMVKPADARQVKAAQGKIRQARDYIDTNRGNLTPSDKDHIEDLFQIAVQYLDNIADERKADKLKAPVLAEIAQVRAQYGTNTTAPPPPPKPATPPPPSQQFYDAKRKVFWANDYFTTPGRVEQTEPELAQAEQLLQGDASREADALRAEMAALRDQLADMVMPSDEAVVRAAQRDVQSVGDYMDRQRAFLHKSDTIEELDGRLQKVVDEGLSKIKHPRKAEQLKAPVLAEIARLRAELGIAVKDRTWQPPMAPCQPPTNYPQTQYQQVQTQRSPEPADTTTLTLSPSDLSLLNRAKRTLLQARSNIESRRIQDVESLLFDASTALSPLADPHKAALLAEISQLRSDLSAARVEEDTRIITSELDRRLGSIESDLGSDSMRYSVQSYTQRFEREDVRRILTPERYRGYEAKFTELMDKNAAKLKREVLASAARAMAGLEERLAGNPFMGLQGYQVSKVDGEVRGLRWQVERELRQLPEEDADRASVEGELKRLDAKLAGYSDAWAKAGLHDEVRRGWAVVGEEVKGWEGEGFELGEGGATALDEPQMPLTRLAIRRAQYYLRGDTYVQRTRDENPGDEVVAEVDRDAEQLLEAAGTKMAEAFDRVMGVAEGMDTPIEDRWLREKPGYLITGAEGTFEKTRFYELVVGRIRALDQRWKDELAAVHKGREGLCERLTTEGVQKWPSIVAGIRTVSGFDPSSARPGDAVHLQGVYNRAGWDFGGEYGFSMRFNGVPLGGFYEPYINTAMEHAAYGLKLRIDDHEAWDLVGVVLGPGSINERTKRTIRRGMDTEEIEEWLPIECLRMRVIALRAGPVVVGPQS